MKVTVVPARFLSVLVCFSAAMGFAQVRDDPSRSRDEIRQICAPEFDEYSRGPSSPITQNTIGIIPTRTNVDELSRSFNMIAANIVNGDVPRVNGLLSLCIFRSRIYQLNRGGAGDVPGARDDWVSFRTPFEQRLRNVDAARGGSNPSNQSSQPSVRPSGTAPVESSSACAGTPDATLARFNSDLQQFINRNPQPTPTGPGASAGARAQHQWAFFVGTEGLNMLEPLRACLGPHYAPNKTALEGMRDAGRVGCQRLSTDPSSCVPRMPS